MVSATTPHLKLNPYSCYHARKCWVKPLPAKRAKFGRTEG